MIPLYIVLYLVVGLIVKWLMERYIGLPFDNGFSTIAILIWPVVSLLCVFVIAFHYTNEKASYTRIRKFFRGF